MAAAPKPVSFGFQFSIQMRMVDERTLKSTKYNRADFVLSEGDGERPDSQPDHTATEREPFAETIGYYPEKTLPYQRLSKLERKRGAVPSKQEEAAKGQSIGRN